MRATCFLLLLAAGCGSKNVGSVVRPREVTAGETLAGGRDESTTCSASDDDRTLVVDAPVEDRKALEEMVKGQLLPVTQYDCKAIKILERCKIATSFAYTGTALRDRVVHIDSADEAVAQLPLSSATLRASVRSGQKVDLALAEVGSRASTFESLAPLELPKEGCENATHFVRKIDVGAFALVQRASGEAASAAEVFAASASGESRSTRSSTQNEGRVEQCRKAREEDRSSPEGCGVPIRVHLRRIKAQAKTAPTIALGPGGVRTSESVSSSCADGQIRSEGGVCITGAPPARWVCKGDDVAECTTQCERGSAESCVKQSWFYLWPKGNVPADRPRARAILEKICVANRPDPKGCLELGTAHENWQGETPPSAADVERARAAWLIGCRANDATTCSVLASSYESPSGPDAPVDYQRSAYFLERACNLGDGAACKALGMRLLFGFGNEHALVDPPHGVDLLERGCRMGEEEACSTMASELERGVRVPRDAKRAANAFRDMCAKGKTLGCVEYAVLQIQGDGAVRDPAAARPIVERHCLESNVPLACYGLGVLAANGEGGVRKDEGRATELFEKSRTVKDAAARAARALEAKGIAKSDPARVASLHARACQADSGIDVAACKRGAALYEKANKKAEARILYATICTKEPKDRASCAKAGVKKKKLAK